MKKQFLGLTCGILSLATTAFAMGSAPQIENFYQVGPGVYRGARPSATAMDELTDFGIKSIVNLQGGDLHSSYPSWLIAKMEPGELPEAIEAEKAKALSMNMHYLNTPIDSLDDVTPEEDRAIDQTLAFIADPQNQPVFVHCEHGQDRTGMVIALYEVKYMKVSIQAAHEEMIKRGHDKLHQVFTHDMDDYFFKKANQILEQNRPR
jgi:protein tyrosine/serine phosphatase